MATIPHGLRQLVVVVSLAFLSACSSNKSESQLPVKIGYLPIIAHLPAAVASERGFLGNLNVQFRVYGTSDDLLAALAKGDIDVATTVAVAPLARYYTKRLREHSPATVKMISYSRTYSSRPFDGVFVKEGSAIHGLGDLTGSRIGVFPGTTARNVLSYLLVRDYKVDTSTLNWVYLPPSAQIEALSSGDIDVLYAYETSRTLAALNGFPSIHGSVISAVLEGAPYGCSAVNTAFYENRRATADAVIEGLDRGILATRDPSEDAHIRAVIERELGVPPDVSKRCNVETRLTSKEILEDSNVVVLQEFLGVLVRAGELHDAVDANQLVINDLH